MSCGVAQEWVILKPVLRSAGVEMPLFWFFFMRVLLNGAEERKMVLRRFWTLEGPEKTVNGLLICEELNVMVFVVGMLLCRPESCLGCRFPYFRHLIIESFFQVKYCNS